jgi:RimJ/RimL family protein N-acetyltransferase
MGDISMIEAIFVRPMMEEDIPSLLELYAHARRYMAETGNPNQWADDYPSVELLRKDMNNGGYVIQDEDTGCIVGAFILEENAHELAYNTIEGRWLNDKPYAVIHRCATLHNQKGIGQLFMDWCFEKFPNIRVDTHKDNAPMIKFLEKNNFTYCGIVYYERVGARLAYQKEIPPIH